MTPLSQPLPLRRTTEWGTYLDDEIIPHRFGRDVSGALIQYNQTRTVFVWAGHAGGPITKVTNKGQTVSEWIWRNGIDAAGFPACFVEFGQPQDLGAELIATGDGMPHPVRGGVMQNPAALAWHVLANLAGWPASEARFDPFRIQCDAAGLVAAGSIEQADSPQTVLRSICGSVGGVFAADADYLCRLWPGADLDPPRETIDYRHTLKASVSRGDICNDLTITFDYQNGRPRSSLQFEAPDSVARYGRQPDSIAAPWLTSARTAYAVAVRLLQQRARPAWDVAASNLGSPLKPIDAVLLDHPVLPLGGEHLVQSRTYSGTTGKTSIAFEAPAGPLPAFRLIRQSATFEDLPIDLGVETIGSNRVLTIRDLVTFLPLIGAAVTVDNTITRTTDDAGRVVFPVAVLGPGEHRLDILTADGRRLAVIITIGADGNLGQTILMPPLEVPPEAPPPYYSG